MYDLITLVFYCSLNSFCISFVPQHKSSTNKEILISVLESKEIAPFFFFQNFLT